MFGGIVGLIIQLIAGAVGGNIVGAAAKQLDLGPVWNSVAGIVGGGIGRQILGAMLGGGAAASGHPAQAGLGRPRSPGRAGPAAASGASVPAARCARDAVGLASSPCRPFMDLPEPARPPDFGICAGAMRYVDGQ